MSSRPIPALPMGLIVVALGMLALPTARADESARKAPPAPKGESSEWKPLFDGKSLKGWKATDFYRPGKVEVKDGVILLEKGRSMTGITYSKGDFPTLDYEVVLQGKKVDGDDFFCTTTFPFGKTHCSLVVGGWGGSVVGLSSINGADASENVTNSFREFKKDQWYDIRIRVSKDRIEAWINKDKCVDLDTTDLQISVRLECIPCQPFGVATWYTTGAVRDIRVRRLTDAEKKAIRDNPPKEE